MKTNYHTHTSRCNHAYGTEEEYILTAIDHGFKVIGFSDHSPTTPTENNTTSRMRADEIDDYVSTILRLKEKYEDQIDVKLSYEVDAHPGNIEWIKKNVIYKYDLDYVIFGNHFDGVVSRFTWFGRHYPKMFVLRRYLKRAQYLMETDMFDIMAHPDLFMLSYKVWDKKAQEMSEKLCDLALKHDVILEYNLAGARRHAEYPCPDFWRVVADKGNKVIIGVDAHHPNDIADTDTYEEAERFLSNLGINVIKEL